MKIFISYKSDEAAIVSKLYEDLRLNGFDVWLDQKELLPGNPWEDEIELALDECTHMIAVLTPEATQSHVIRAEWGFFLSHKKPILPLLLRDTDIPLLLQPLQYVDFRRSYELGLNRLLEGLRGVMQSSEVGASRAEIKRRTTQEVSRESSKLTWDIIHKHTQIFSEKVLGAEYKEKYEPQSYLQRQETLTQFQKFIESDRTVTVLTGKAGTGKSSFICSLITEELPNLAVWLRDCRHLELGEGRTISSYIHDSLDLPPEIDVVEAFRHLHSLDPVNKIVFIFDAVNEAADPELLLSMIAEFVLHVDSVAIKVLITCRMPTWAKIRRSFEVSVFKEFHTAGPNSYISLSVFEEKVLEAAYEKYKVTYNLLTPFQKLSDEVKKFITEPLFLKLTAFTYEGKALPNTLALNTVFDSYINKCLCGQQEDCDPYTTPEFIILRKAIELMFGLTRSRLQLSLLKQDAEIAPYIDETIRSRTPYTNLLSEGLLSQTDDQDLAQRIAIIFVTFERVFEYLLAKLMITRVDTKSIEELLKTAKTSSFMQLRGAAELALSLSIINGQQSIASIVELARSEQLESRQFLSDVIQTIYSTGKIMLVEATLTALIEDDHVESHLLAIQVAYQLRFDDLLVRLAVSKNERVHDIASLYIYQRWNTARLKGDVLDGYKVIEKIVSSIRLKSPTASSRAVSVLVFLSVSIFAHIVDDAPSVYPLLDIFRKMIRTVRQDPNQDRTALERFLADRALDVITRVVAIALEASLNRAGFTEGDMFDTQKAFRDLFETPRAKRLLMDSSFFWDVNKLTEHEDKLVQILTKENPIVSVHFRAPILYHLYYETDEHLPLLRRLFDRTTDYPLASAVLTNVIVYCVVYKLIQGKNVSDELMKEAQESVIDLWYKLDETALLAEIASSLTGIFHAEAILQRTTGTRHGSITFKNIATDFNLDITRAGLEVLLSSLERFAYQGYPEFAILTLLDEKVRKVWEARAYDIGIRTIANLRAFYQVEIDGILSEDEPRNKQLHEDVKISGSTPKPSEVSAYAFLLLGIATSIEPTITKVGGNIIMNFATTKSLSEALQQAVKTAISSLYNFELIDIGYMTWYRRHDPKWDNFEKWQIPRDLDTSAIQPEMRKYAVDTIDGFISTHGRGIMYGEL